MKHSLLAVLLAVTIQLQACPTTYDSLYPDWRSTQTLIARYGMQAEANPVIRLAGPDAYFGTLIIGTAASCRKTPAWRWVAFGTWAVQTWAVNTHNALGTMRGVPLLHWTVRWP